MEPHSINATGMKSSLIAPPSGIGLSKEQIHQSIVLSAITQPASLKGQFYFIYYLFIFIEYPALPLNGV